MNPVIKVSSLKVDINTPLGEIGSNIVSICVPVFRVGPSEYFIKFQTKLHIIIRGQSLKTGPQMYTIKKNLLEL